MFGAAAVLAFGGVAGVARPGPPALAAGGPFASVGNARIWEGDAGIRTAKVPVTLSAPSLADITVGFTVSAATATAGVPKNAPTDADFKARTGTLKFPKGAVVRYAPVVVFGDGRPEGDETVRVEITSADGASVGASTGTATIVEDDSPTSTGATVSVGDASIYEGDTKVRAVDIPLTLSRPAAATVVVSYQLVPVTASGGWPPPSLPPTDVDFADKRGAVFTTTFKANLAGITPVNKVVAVRVAPDTTGEDDETFSVVILNVQGPAAVGDGTGTGTILDDDVPATAALTVAVAGAGVGSVSSSPSAISCPTVCAATFAGGTTVTLLAVPDAGSSFAGWSGACVGTGSCIVDLQGDRMVTATFAVAPPPTVWTQIAAGRDHSCGLTGGRVYCWGLGVDGELGDGTNTVKRKAPSTPVSGLTGVTAIAAGDYHSCALTAAGGVWCWGMNAKGQLGNGSTTDSTVPVPVTGLTSGVVDISAGVQDSCAIDGAGALSCWGTNTFGQLGDGTTSDHAVPVVVSGFSSGALRVSAGNRHTCAVSTVGAARCWGWNALGQLGDGSTTDSPFPVPVFGLGAGVLEVAALGAGHTCAVTGGGAAQCWGANSAGELGDGATASSAVPVPVSGLSSGVTAIAVGGYIEGDVLANSCAITGGVGSCWGDNGRGQLGDGGGSSTDAPVTIALGDVVTQISTGQDHSCVLTSTGRAYCWGRGSYGQLGDGGEGAGSLPVAVIGP
jgi:alpha-tubulin suppressor-like RCC1 family protein